MASASSSTTSSSSLFSSSTLIPNITHLVLIKLDRTNYVLWLAQFVHVLRSNTLIGFVDGTKPCPSQFPLDKDNKVTIGLVLKYLEGQQLDQTLLSWINAALTP